MIYDRVIRFTKAKSPYLVFASLSYSILTFNTAWVGKTQWRNFPSCQMESSLFLKASRDGDWQSHVVWSPGKVAEADYWLAGQFVTWLDCRLLFTLNRVTNCEKTATTEIKTDGFNNFTFRSISRCCGTQGREVLLLMKVLEQLITATLEFSIKEPKWQKTYLPSQAELDRFVKLCYDYE